MPLSQIDKNGNLFNIFTTFDIVSHQLRANTDKNFSASSRTVARLFI